MGFKHKFLPGLVANVLLCGTVGWAQNQESSRVIVFVIDAAGLKPAVLRHAETEAGRLFRAAGVAIHWVNCGNTADCRRPPHEDEFILHIVPKGETQSDFVFGEAFLGPNGEGKYADVFFHRILEMNREVNTGQLLGDVAAHELGHLLLGSHAHSLAGIMAPVWRRDMLVRIGMGNLGFTPEQGRLMRTRLAPRVAPYLKTNLSTRACHWHAPCKSCLQP